MHVFLTGPVQIGKSTLIAAALEQLRPERLGGFAPSRQSRRRTAAGPSISIPPPRRICSARSITASASAIRRSASHRFRMHLRRQGLPRWRARRTATSF